MRIFFFISLVSSIGPSSGQRSSLGECGSEDFGVVVNFREQHRLIWELHASIAKFPAILDRLFTDLADMIEMGYYDGSLAGREDSLEQSGQLRIKAVELGDLIAGDVIF